MSEPSCTRRAIVMRRVTVLALGLTFLLSSSVPASAQPAQVAEGTALFDELEIISQRFAGPNRIEVRRISGEVDGDFVGTWTQTVRGVIHPNGQVTFSGTWTFTGVAAECGEGTVSGRLTGRGEAGPLPQTVANVTSTGPGNVADGRGTVLQNGPFASYSISYRC